MAFREFTDSVGNEWTVFDVKPRTDDRRSYDRRSDGADARKGPDDLRVDDRRVTVGANHPVRLTTGWLCFESADERRRLQPIPASWPDATKGDLREWLDSAQPAPNRRVVAREAGL